jgi:hypothetical protein
MVLCILVNLFYSSTTVSVAVYKALNTRHVTATYFDIDVSSSGENLTSLSQLLQTH